MAHLDGRKVLSGIIFVIKNGLRWCDATKEYGSHKTLYNRFVRWSKLGVFNRIFKSLAAQGLSSDQLAIDSIYIKAHRTSAGLLKKGSLQDLSAE